MKRGLVVLDEEETPRAVFKQRVAALQRALAEQGVIAAFVYGDVYHSGDITYLSNICLYWNEAILAVPVQGEPALLTKLSRRVHPWMRRTSSLDDLRSGPHLAVLAREFIDDLGEGPVGLVEEAWWPASLLIELRDALGPQRSVDLGEVVRRERKAPSGSELRLLRSASTLTARAVGDVLDPGLTPEERAGRAELTARQGGVEDVSVYSHLAGPDAEVVEVIGEFRGYWTSAARVLSRSVPPWARAIEAGFRAAATVLRDGVTANTVRSAAGPHLSELDMAWQLELLHHVDVETGGGYRLPSGSGEPFRAGAVVSMRLSVELPDSASAVVGDTYLLGASGSERLTNALADETVVSAA